jgi:hypothetical protein
MDQLFIHLVLRLRHYPEAAVLWSLIRVDDDGECKTSAYEMAHNRLDGIIDRISAQRAFKVLKAKELIKTRIHKNTATLVKVNREAVLDLLENGEEFFDWLPGQFNEEVGFLKAWDERRQAKAAAQTISTHESEPESESGSVPGSMPK